MILFFDTETTGLVRDWNCKYNQANPKLMQLGMVACEDSGRSLFTFGTLIKPYYPREEINDGAFAAHGISFEMCDQYGVPLQEALDRFINWSKSANTLVAHNIKFDECVMMNAIGSNEDLDNKFCTMLESTNICKIPGKKGFKWPKLSEAYKHFFGEELVDAHDAITDVMACKKIYFELMKMRIAV